MSYIFDIDGTIADCSHRLHFIAGPEKDWDSFKSHEAIMADKPIGPVIEVFTRLAEYHDITFITGRDESQRYSTELWLEYNLGVLALGCLLGMRENGDRRKSHVTKEENLLKLRLAGVNPVVAFEDRKADADMWRRNGLICCHVAEGNF
jgi:hypothetical protein